MRRMGKQRLRPETKTHGRNALDINHRTEWRNALDITHRRLDDDHADDNADRDTPYPRHRHAAPQRTPESLALAMLFRGAGLKLCPRRPQTTTTPAGVCCCCAATPPPPVFGKGRQADGARPCHDAAPGRPTPVTVTRPGTTASSAISHIASPSTVTATTLLSISICICICISTGIVPPAAPASPTQHIHHSSTTTTMKTVLAASTALAALAAASPQGPRGGPWGDNSADGPWASGAPSQWSSVQSAIASWTSAESITAWPTAASEWSSFTSAYSLPTQLSSAASWWSSNGFPQVTGAPGGAPWGGPGGPHGGPGGWSGGSGMGPFGAGHPGNGWGPWGEDGDWTSGAWTSWWGTGACPASTWSGKSRIPSPLHLPSRSSRTDVSI